jgi:hypothetical protein
MSVRTSLAIGVVLMALSSVQAQEQKATTSDPSYKLVWADEFDYRGAPDPNK